MSPISILAGILLLSVMMIVHELGHFLAGKALGFKIVSYNIFMGPILYKHRGKDGVLYTLRLVPLGASVEFAGEGSGINEAPEDSREAAPVYADNDPGLFYNRPRWRRAIVIAMGPLVNFITAFLAFILVFVGFGVLTPVIGAVQPESAAAKAGLLPGDRLLSLNGYGVQTALDSSIATFYAEQDGEVLRVRHPDGSISELNLPYTCSEQYRLGITYTPRDDGRLIIQYVDPQSNDGSPVLEVGDELLSINGISVQDAQAFQAAIADGSTEPSVELRILRRGREQTLQMKVTLIRSAEPLGYTLRPSESLGEALGQALVYPISVVRSTFKGLSLIFSGALRAEDGLTGPIGIVTMVGDAVAHNSSLADLTQQLLMLFGLISVAIGFTNLLPIPPFDGFQILVIAIEALRRRDLSLKLKGRLAYLGLGIMLLLAAYVFYIDIARLLR